jgi:hypothetical protein
MLVVFSKVGSELSIERDVGLSFCSALMFCYSGL